MWRDLQHSLMLAVSVAARIAIMLGVFKYLSTAFGVEGFGLLSQTMAAGSLFATFAGGGPPTGIVREVAAAKSASEKSLWLKAGFVVSLGSAFVMVMMALTIYFWFSAPVMGDIRYAWVFLVIALAQLPIALGSTSLAFLSGSNMPSAYAISTSAGAVVAAILVVCFGYVFGFNGAVAACALFALGPAFVGLCLAVFLRAGSLLRALDAPLQMEKLKRLLSYSAKLIVAATAVPIATLFMRASLGSSDGWHVVGEWQSVARIGDAYVQAFGAIFINLMLPRLAAHQEPASQLQTLRHFGLIVMVPFAFVALIFWGMSGHILRIVYSEGFSGASSYVFPQLLADFLKISASLFMYLFIARGKPGIQAIGEVVQAATMILSFEFLVQTMGGVAAVWSYAIGVMPVLVLLMARQCFVPERARA